MSALPWKRILPLCCLIILTLLFFHQLAFSGKILARGDTYNYFYPYWDARNQAFRAGELPLWTSDLFMGVPLLANPQIGAYYPPNWLTAPFRAPTAIALSILLHIALAAAGTCFLYRQVVSKRWLPALAAGVIFAFGGYLGAHVEQINQLQGLAWMPILFALFHRALNSDRPLPDGLLLAMAWALQVFSGHTQTVFISGIGLGVFGLAFSAARSDRRLAPAHALRTLLLLAGCFTIALLLALPQLLPSLELLRTSDRSGGFTVQEATSFSLPLSMLGRAFLPSYDGQLFGEYVSHIGIFGLGLALWGLFSHSISRRQKWTWLLLAGVGLALALGRYNPLYLLLAELPGFNFFRVPARFLALFSLAMALLAGIGIEALYREGQPSPGQRRGVLAVAGIIALLIVLSRLILRPDEGLIFGGAAISNLALGLWLGTGLALISLLLIRHRWIPIAAVVLLTLELFLSSLNMPFNDLSPPELYLGQRFTISQLLAFQADEPAPGRTLSISQIFFDPPDITELRARFDRLGMDAAAQFHALDAVKKQETLMPNLALTWGIPTIDGFGGGITPSHAYAQFGALLLPTDAAPPVDGRLGEHLAQPKCWSACIPDLRWLRATDTRYLITDKVYDIWHEDIAYDTSLARFWRDVKRLDLPGEIGDQVRVLHSAPFTDGGAALSLPHDLFLTITDEAGLQRILQREEGIMAITLVNREHTRIFQEIQPPPFERVLSSAIKVYRLPEGQRAFLAPTTRILPDNDAGDAEALQLMRAGAALVIHDEAAAQIADLTEGGSVDIVNYDQTRVSLQVTSPAPAYLVFADAWYPGWLATVNGAQATLYRANLIFRALRVPAGDSAVEFRFEPQLWRAALYIGVGLWITSILIWLGMWRRGRAQSV